MQYRYKARTGSNELTQGSIAAESRDGAVQRLLHQGYAPLEVWEENTGTTSVRERLGRLRNKEVVLLTRQLADLLVAGMILSQALELLVQAQEGQTPLRRLLEAISRRVEGGRSFAEALEDFPKVFSAFYVAAVRAGEVGGFLDEVLLHLAQVLEKEDEARSKIRRALAYPIFMGCVGLVTLVILFAFVVPTLSALFVDLGQELPRPTRILMALGSGMERYGWLGLPLLAGLVVLFNALRRVPEWALRMDGLVLKLPWLGRSVRTLEMARFLAILGALLKADVGVIHALEVAQAGLKNRMLRTAVDRVRAEVSMGRTVGESFRAQALFPALLGSVLAAGEESNRLGEAMERLARAYDREMEEALGLVTALLEPSLIVVLGSLVAFIVTAMLLPIFQADFAAY